MHDDDQTEELSPSRSGRRRTNVAPKRDRPRERKTKPASWLPAPVLDDAGYPGEPVDLTEDQVRALTTRSFNYCVWLLGNSAKAGRQLREALTKKGVPEPIQDDVLTQLTDFGYVNDSEFADMVVRAKYGSAQQGSGAIRRTLLSKGVSADIVATALEQIDSEVEESNARSLAVKKLRQTVDLPTKKRVDRASGALIRRGYSPSIVFRIIREVLESEGEEMDDIND